MDDQESYVNHDLNQVAVDLSNSLSESDDDVDNGNSKFEEGESSKHNEEESCFSNDYVSPGGTTYWIPKVAEQIKPKINSVFQTYDAAIKMYKDYALDAGFDVRKGTTHKMTNETIKVRYMLCNREGKPNTGELDTLDSQHNKIPRRKYMFRCECKAKIIFHLVPCTSKYMVFDFVESHNHTLISKSNMHLSRTKRQLDFSQHQFIHNMSKQNIGPVKAHRIMTGIQGGYSGRGGLQIDYKNYSKNLNCFIGGRDAKMIVDKMNDRKKYVRNFSFEYKVEGKQLNAMFWADETAKFNYDVFGDVVSFDATYNTNRYNMVYVPFTGIDNHKRCVTFGAGLLSREDADSYMWLLRSFLKAFGKQPRLVLSDQDLAMKKAIKEVLPLSQHRLCMWHITSKLTSKLSWDVANNSDLKKRFNALIWNSKIDELHFENGWLLLLKDFNLSDNKWLKDMYALRTSWVPAFFKNVPMSGLMRTTSLSESQNWAFQNTCLTGSYLTIFMMTFDSVMERQRHNQSVNDFDTANKYPKTITYLPYEVHAADVYTRKIFYQVQEEIHQSEKSCFQKNVFSMDGVDTFVILEKKKSISTKKTANVDEDNEVEDYHYDYLFTDSEFKVTHSTHEGSFSCSCMHFEHLGILCRHVFCVLKFYGLEKIPDRYVLRRWRKEMIPTEFLRLRFQNSYNESNTDKSAIEIFSAVDHCVSLLSYDPVKLQEYLDEQNKLKLKFVDDSSPNDTSDKDSRFAKVLGVRVPDVVDIENPSDIRNKGYGSRGKILKSKKEMMIEQGTKPKRLCIFCKQLAYHDKRNCPLKKKKS